MHFLSGGLYTATQVTGCPPDKRVSSSQLGITPFAIPGLAEDHGLQQPGTTDRLLTQHKRKRANGEVLVEGLGSVAQR